MGKTDNRPRDPNFREKLNAKAKRKRNFFRKKMRSESEANLLLLNAKKCEANPFQKIAKKMRKSYKKCENFAKILNEALRCIKARFFTKIKVSRVSNLALYYNHSILSKGRHLLALSMVIFFVLNPLRNPRRWRRLFISFRFSFLYFSTNFQKFPKIRIVIKFFIQIDLIWIKIFFEDLS